MTGLYQDETYPYSDGGLTVEAFTYNPALMPLNPPPMNTKGKYVKLQAQARKPHRHLKYVATLVSKLPSCEQGGHKQDNTVHVLLIISFHQTAGARDD